MDIFVYSCTKTVAYGKNSSKIFPLMSEELYKLIIKSRETSHYAEEGYLYILSVLLNWVIYTYNKFMHFCIYDND